MCQFLQLVDNVPFDGNYYLGMDDTAKDGNINSHILEECTKIAEKQPQKLYVEFIGQKTLQLFRCEGILQNS